MVARSFCRQTISPRSLLSAHVAPFFVERPHIFAVSAGDPIFDLDRAPLDLGVDLCPESLCEMPDPAASKTISGRPGPQEKDKLRTRFDRRVTLVDHGRPGS
jgi:hypothetical protein